jgi:AcrR family transcriptional regulator
MGRHRDLERRTELLDEVVGYLGRNGVAGVSLRPVARELGVSVNALVHHFGSKDELVVAALRRAAEIQRAVEGRWRRQVPHLSTAELQRRWWRWINRRPEHLALVRLGLEAATLDATVSGLPGDVRAEQISFWREDIAARLIADGIKPEDAEREASLAKATFTGLVLDLLATGQRKRLTDALECSLRRLDNLRQTTPPGRSADAGGQDGVDVGASRRAGGVEEDLVVEGVGGDLGEVGLGDAEVGDRGGQPDPLA